jgi:hypothetical protein
MKAASLTYSCPVCPSVKVESRDVNDTLARAPYCDYCIIPMNLHYGSVTR